MGGGSHPERAFLWIRPEMRDRLGYLDEARDGVGLPAGAAEDLVRAVHAVCGDILVRDVTTPDIRELGAVVVKVIVPGLQPMHLSEVDRRWTDRLLTFSDPAEGLNPLPHPFLWEATVNIVEAAGYEDFHALSSLAGWQVDRLHLSDSRTWPAAWKSISVRAPDLLPCVPLPTPEPLSATLTDILSRRRSRREPGTGVITEAQLGTLLGWGLGHHQQTPCRAGRRTHHRSVVLGTHHGPGLAPPHPTRGARLS
ncbi:YcaO-like family protein [Actinocrispum sp. NPDC049592]|uniref:YcaO-like family protein n=1 Tax=Actinocrispum sp. NPDC049592 TaxID=3154835 RepID=UPI00343737F7